MSEDKPAPHIIDKIRFRLITLLGVALSLFTLCEVNYQLLTPLSQLAIFGMFGLVISYLSFPTLKRWENVKPLRFLDMALALGSVVCCSYLIVQGSDLGNRAGAYTPTDVAIAVVGILLVLEATRRSIGLALPILASVFLVYAMVGPNLPDWMFPHRGYDLSRVASVSFLNTGGVFGTALRVMFTYVYLFVVFGAFLEVSGATQFIVDFAQRIFGKKPGGAAKVAVLGSGLMGSLSGSAVANAVTTGTFTIPMMRSSGFKPHVAGGITAAAATGGALVPPVMGAGAYMMLEIVEPAVTFIQIVKAALIPAILYYLSLFFIVHFYAKRTGADAKIVEVPKDRGRPFSLEGGTFFGALAVLIGLLISGRSPVLAVTASLAFIFVLTLINPKIDAPKQSRIIGLALFPVLWIAIKLIVSAILMREEGAEGLSNAGAGVYAMVILMFAGMLQRQWRPLIVNALVKSAKNGISLISASACVGIIIGVVTLTGVGTALPNAIVPLAEHSLFLALVAIMFCSILLGMGLPSAVCYLLMATLIGPVLSKLGVAPLAAHLFIFYFGMMSMVTPPVALAAYASASIAGSPIMKTGLAAFRFALVGFTLPFMFIYRPELLMIPSTGDHLSIVAVIMAVTGAVLGILSLAAGLAGYLFKPLGNAARAAMFVAAALALFPGQGVMLAGIKFPVSDIAGAIILCVVAFQNHRGPTTSAGAPPPTKATATA
ncbi:MAG: TRAP transporter 4TM/12TM fusion protein [Candidatus Binatia bacterium]|jgi:TRAP transporter 4TM/12TM fusion protein